MKKTVCIREGTLTGAQAVLDFTVPPYRVRGEGISMERRFIAFRNPDIIMTIYDDPTYAENETSCMVQKTPEQFDTNFRSYNIKGLGFVGVGMALEEWKIYRKIMGCYRDKGDFMSKDELVKLIEERKGERLNQRRRK
jgi:hypothetical protein